ncbi:MAG: peroxiredoxin [Myxococcota bacterium]|nr:peroxiredoxin [Myxococcota bacterium]
MNGRFEVTGVALSVVALALVVGCGSGQSGSGGTALVRMGDPAPDFMLADQTGRVRQLSEYRGQPLVLYFYPRDATPGCTREACAFRDAWTQLQETGARVVGVSTDDVESHRRFAEEHQLPFELLADLEGEVAQRYGVPMRLGMSSRVTFLIDADGVVRRVFEEVDPAIHVDEVIAAIQALPASSGGDTGTVPEETAVDPASADGTE